MKKTITCSEFHQAFEEIRPDNFSYKGLNALYEYLTDYEESTGEEIELDVIAICCDFWEYKNLKTFQDEYGDEYTSFEKISEQTALIEIEGNGFIIQTF